MVDGGTAVIIAPVGPAKWATGTAYVVNDVVTPTTPNTYVYACNTPGTSDAATEPTWPTAYWATVTDNGVVWRNISPVVTGERPVAVEERGDGQLVVSYYNDAGTTAVMVSNDRGQTWSLDTI